MHESVTGALIYSRMPVTVSKCLNRYHNALIHSRMPGSVYTPNKMIRKKDKKVILLVTIEQNDSKVYS